MPRHRGAFMYTSRNYRERDAMRVLLVGDIVGKPGRAAFLQVVNRLKAEDRIDFVIANGENAASGRGPTLEIAQSLLNAGADVVTLGDHAWDSKEMVAGIDLDPRIIRPANFSKGRARKGLGAGRYARGRNRRDSADRPRFHAAQL